MTSSTRRHDLDWLRVAAVFLLLFFHSARVFDVNEAFYVQHPDKSAFLSFGVIGFYGRWSMELLFVISGMASWYALRGKSTRAFLRDRWWRLGVPFVVGVILLVPPQAYLAALRQAPEQASYATFLARYFTDWSDLSGYAGTFTPAQLWFVLFLLVYSVVALPFFSWWSSPPRAALHDRLAGLFSGRAALLAWVVPLTGVSALPGIGGKNVLGYLLYFVLGYVLAATPAYQTSIDRDRGTYAFVGFVSWAVLTVVWVTGGFGTPGTLSDVALHALRVVCAWSSVLALLGYAHTYLNVKRAWIEQANEAAFPVYVVHQTVLVAVGFTLVPLALPVSVTYLLIVIGTFIGSLVAFAVIRNVNVLRVLFGLKVRSSRASRSGPRVRGRLTRKRTHPGWLFPDEP